MLKFDYYSIFQESRNSFINMAKLLIRYNAIADFLVNAHLDIHLIIIKKILIILSEISK